MFLPKSFQAAPIVARPLHIVARRSLICSNAVAAAHFSPRTVVKETDIEEAFLKGSGPGGQKIVRQLSYTVDPIHVGLGACSLTRMTQFRTKHPQQSSLSTFLLAWSSNAKLLAHGPRIENLLGAC